MRHLSKIIPDGQDEKEAQRKSGTITAIVALLLFLFLFFYSFTSTTVKIIEPEATIALNFGYDEVGMGEEEPLPSESTSMAAAESASSSTEKETQKVEPKAETIPVLKDKPGPKIMTNEVAEKKIAVKTTNDKKVVEKAKAVKQKTVATSSTKNKTDSKNNGTATGNQKGTAKGDAKGNSAIGALLGGKGKGTSGGQGNGNQIGNQGDPSGGDSNGTSFGKGNRSISKIPMPQFHDCPDRGIIVVEYIVDKTGRVKSASVIKGGTSNNSCLQAKAVALVKKYVRASSGKDNDRATYSVNLK